MSKQGSVRSGVGDLFSPVETGLAVGSLIEVVS